MIYDEEELLADIKDIVGATYAMRLVVKEVTNSNKLKSEHKAALFFLTDYISGLISNAHSNFNVSKR